jgi:hypothetical protein
MFCLIDSAANASLARHLLVALVLLQLVWPSSGVARVAPEQAGSAGTSSLDARLGQEVTDYTLTAGSFLQALTRISAEFRIPMGMVLTGGPEAEHGVKMSWHQVTVRQGLDLLVQSYPGYDLDASGEVLHVYATQAAADGHDFLSVAIPSFETSSSLVADNNRLRETVNRIVVPESHARFSRWFERSAERYRTFAAKNSTVREILDRFLLASDDYKVWVVVYPAEASMTRTGFRRTLSPFDFRVVPDEEQPIWAIFLRGYDPVAHVFNFDWLKGPAGGNSSSSGR